MLKKESPRCSKTNTFVRLRIVKWRLSLRSNNHASQTLLHFVIGVLAF